MKNNNRRKFTRVKGNFDLRIEQFEETENHVEFDLGKIVDMSASGVLFRYSQPMKVGDKIDITFLTPKMLEIFKVNALVVRIEKNSSDGIYQIAVEFFDVKEDIVRILDYYLTNDEKKISTKSKDH